MLGKTGLRNVYSKQLGNALKSSIEWTEVDKVKFEYGFQSVISFRFCSEKCNRVIPNSSAIE